MMDTPDLHRTLALADGLLWGWGVRWWLCFGVTG